MTYPVLPGGGVSLLSFSSDGDGDPSYGGTIDCLVGIHRFTTKNPSQGIPVEPS